MDNFDPYQTPSAANPTYFPSSALLPRQRLTTPRPRSAGRPAPRESADLRDSRGCLLAPDADCFAAVGASGELARVRPGWPSASEGSAAEASGVPGRRGLGGRQRRRLRPRSALRRRAEKAPAFSHSIRPTASLHPGPRFLHSPCFFPPKMGRPRSGLSCVKFLYTSLFPAPPTPPCTHSFMGIY